MMLREQKRSKSEPMEGKRVEVVADDPMPPESDEVVL